MKKFFILFVGLFLSISCGDDDTSNETTTTSGLSTNETTTTSGLSASSNARLLTSWVDNHILPDYKSFLEEANSLKLAKDNFIAAPSEALLVELKTALEIVYIKFQPTAIYQIGSAEELNYYLNLNAHPLDEFKTNNNIFSEDAIDLSSVLQQDAQGLPAVDYLINGLGDTNSEIVSFYTGDSSSNYSAYLSSVVDRITQITEEVITDWETNFRKTFIENTSSSRNGSVDQLINIYIEYFERRLRSSKVGTPAGFFTLPNTFPNQIESLYNPTQSKALLLEALNRAEQFYNGNTNATTSISAELIALGSAELDTRIKTQFEDARLIINSLNDNLKFQIENDNLKMIAARDALQKIVISLKVDMVSILGVDIIFQDNDGD